MDTGQRSMDSQKGPQNKRELQILQEFVNKSLERTDYDVMELWRSLDRMRNELDFPDGTSILKVFALYRSFEEIKSALSLDNSFYNFQLLHDLHEEILEYRKALEIAPHIPMDETLQKIKRNLYLITEQENSSLLGKILHVGNLK